MIFNHRSNASIGHLRDCTLLARVSPLIGSKQHDAALQKSSAGWLQTNGHVFFTTMRVLVLSIISNKDKQINVCNSDGAQGPASVPSTVHSRDCMVTEYGSLFPVSFSDRQEAHAGSLDQAKKPDSEAHNNKSNMQLA